MKKGLFWVSILLVLSVGWMSYAQAKEISGYNLPDSVELDHQTLVLNGASVRKKFVFDIYVVGLYLAKPNHNANSIMSGEDQKPKRIIMIFARDVKAETFFQAISDNVNVNFTQEEKLKYFNEFTKFFEVFKGLDEIQKGDVVVLDYVPKVGLTMIYKNKVVAAIKNDRFFHDILRLWIAKPPQSNLKDDLLGINQTGL